MIWRKAALPPHTDGSVTFATMWPIQIHGSVDHPTQHPKLHLDLYSHFCTAYGRKSLYFTMGRHFPLHNCPFTWGIWIHHLIHGSTGPPVSRTKMSSRSVKPFWQGSRSWQTTMMRYINPRFTLHYITTLLHLQLQTKGSFFNTYQNLTGRVW